MQDPRRYEHNRSNRKLALEIVVGLGAFLLLFLAFEVLVAVLYAAIDGPIP